MPSTGFPLTGVSPQSPLPGLKRELLFAQGTNNLSGQRRDVVLVGNKTAGGSRTVDGYGFSTDTVQGPIASSADFEAQFGRRSELYWMYNKLTAVDPSARVWVVAVPENASATAATRVCTFATTATDTTTLLVEWGGETLEVTVNSGDTAETQAANVVAKVNQQAYWPFTAATGVAPADDEVTFTAANGGPRGDLVLNRIRIRYRKSVGSTATFAATTSGTNADDFTSALSALQNYEFYYHVAACTTTSAPTSTDNGVGEYITFIANQALPANGKEQVVSFGLVGTQAQATTVATASAANSVRAFFWHAENSPWTPAMLAAHCTGVMRSQQIAHPAANLTGYTNSDSTPFQVPEPYDSNDRPTTTEQESDLDNGVTPIAFGPNGAAYIVRQVTSRSWLGTSATKDYRAREGHIPSVIDYAWGEVKARYIAQRQPHVAADPLQGQKPVKGVMYPSSVRKILEGVIDDLSGPAVGGIPLLDPSPEAIARMKASIEVVDMVDGISAKCDFEPIRHNNKGNFRISQTGPGY